ncbi:MAG TPA: hypothetical protein VMD59_16405 [Acidimicrobiales bacterium]|nr:hypothetical protein [Acidimicrobiales bacterium]
MITHDRHLRLEPNWWYGYAAAASGFLVAGGTFLLVGVPRWDLYAPACCFAFAMLGLVGWHRAWRARRNRRRFHNSVP